MSRVEFMQQLEKLLFDLSESDRIDVISYYNDYFDEAGPENEANVIRELGSPEKVAATIKADLNTSGNEQAEYTEQGYSDGRKGVNPNTPATRKERKSLPPALIVILIVFAAPVILGVGGGLLGGVLGLAGGLIGILAGGFGMLIGGVTSLIGGIVKLAFSPIQGLFLIGKGSLCLAIGILFVVILVLCILKWFPKLFRIIVDAVKKLIEKIKGGI